jgi:RimJ/RimL family protein N-acetyltransferase
MSELMWVDDTPLTVRPIEITDVDRLARFFERLSPETIHFRFFSPIRKPPRAALLRLADVDHTNRDALIALDGDEIVAVARYDATDAQHAEIAITVEDAWQHRGVGKRLTRRLAVIASGRGYDEFTATMLPDNRRALGLMHKLSPDTKVTWARGEYEAHMPLPHAS